jgi:hypothetical protein
VTVAFRSRIGRLVVPAALVVAVVGGATLAITSAACHGKSKPVVDARRVDDAPHDGAHRDGAPGDAPTDTPLV